MFVHLHTHSHFSLLSGLASPVQLAERAAKLGMPALALADRDRLTGAIDFYDACLKNGVQPIIGLDVPVKLAAGISPRLVFLAEDLAGWGSLCRLSSLLLDSKAPQPDGIPLEDVQAHSRGLICLTGSPVGWPRAAAAQQALGSLKDVFSGSLYVELQTTPSAGQPAGQPNGLAALAVLAQRMGLPTAATGSVFYLEPAQQHLQHLISAIRLNSTLQAVPPDEIAPTGSHFTSADEMSACFEHFPAALASIDEIRARCRLQLPLGELKYPRINLPGGQSPDEALRQKAYAGAAQLYGETGGVPAEKIRARLAHELSVIETSGYASLFLIMEEVIRFAREADVPYSSRGSAGSSLVAHCLGITSPDPVRLDLYFERFLNPERHTPPDIDTDLSSSQRDVIIRHVYQHYGADQVAMVGTINRFRPRSALRETAKAHGLPQNEINRLIALIPGYWGPPRKEETDEENGIPDSLAPILARFPGERYRRIIEDASALLGLPDHLSVHPGGVVIAPGEMHDIAPTQAAEKGVRIVQFDLDQVERLGLVKMDLLGTRGLSVLSDVTEKLRIANKSLHKISFLENIPNKDQVVSNLIRTGRTVGCFGIESPGMQRTMREIQASTPDDLMVALSLYRPGPMKGGLKDAFVDRHLGRRPVEHLHPALSTLLADTYGVILYQEQVLRIAHELAGFSLAEADLLRRAMSHFDPGERMKTLRDKFIRGAQDLHSVPPETGARIWDMMAAFAGYGFPKAHAASYAQVAWRSAWCKVHYPAEFLAAVLANWGGYYHQDVYLLEARRMGLQVRGPHINHSVSQFSAVTLDGQPVLFMGLDQIRELTRGTQQRIMDGRPFASLNDFITRAAPRAKEIEYLVRVGALEGLGAIPQLLRQIPFTGGHAGRHAGQMELFQPAAPEDAAPDWSLEEKAAAQQELLGIPVIAHPLDLARERFERLNVTPIRAAKEQNGRMVRIGGIRQSWRKQRSGREYVTVLDDLTDGMTIVVNEPLYNAYREILSWHYPMVLEGIVRSDRRIAEAVLMVQKLVVE